MEVWRAHAIGSLWFYGPLTCRRLSGLMPEQWSQLDGVCLSAFQILSRGCISAGAEHSRDERSRGHSQSRGIQSSRAKSESVGSPQELVTLASEKAFSDHGVVSRIHPVGKKMKCSQ